MNYYDEMEKIERILYMEKRPFFSVIVGCYNSSPQLIANLLSTLINQNLDKDDMEVILVDDNSDDNEYMDTAAKFADSLNIAFIPNTYRSWKGPAASRQTGLEAARGEWITFADHDDEFINGTLGVVKEIILENKEEYAVATQFCYVTEDNELIRQIEPGSAWNHGKFYNLDKLIRKYNIGFREELPTHEDVCFSTQVKCALYALKRDYLKTDVITYKWVFHPSSESNKFTSVEVDGQIYQVGYLLNYFDDYLYSTYGVLKEYFQNGTVDLEFFKLRSMGILLHCYFYSESLRTYFPDTLTNKMMQGIRAMCHELLDIGKSSVEEIWNYAAADEARNFQIAEHSASMGLVGFVPKHTLMEFLNDLEDANGQATIGKTN